MRYFRYALMIVLLLFGISFACLNAQPVKINYFLGDATISLPLLLALALLCGAFLGYFVSVPKLLSAFNDNRKLRKRLQSLEEEVSNLRSIPILTKP